MMHIYESDYKVSVTQKWMFRHCTYKLDEWLENKKAKIKLKEKRFKLG